MCPVYGLLLFPLLFLWSLRNGPVFGTTSNKNSGLAVHTKGHGLDHRLMLPCISTPSESEAVQVIMKKSLGLIGMV